MTPTPAIDEERANLASQAEQLAEELRQVPTFADLPDEDLRWLASRMTVVELSPGEVYLREGVPADRLIVLLEGEIRARRESLVDSPTYVMEKGEVSGMLPYSRMREFPVTTRAVGRCRLACLSTEHFPAMLERLPHIGQRLVGIMSDRIREGAREDVQREKLMALGKLSAGLAHELNNPAAALSRGAEGLRRAQVHWQEATLRLDGQALTPDQRVALWNCEQQCVARLDTLPVLDSLAQSDREEAVVAQLEAHGVAEAWRFAPALVESGFTEEHLQCLTREFPAAVLSDVAARFTATLAIERLLREMQSSAGRISDLVRSVKEYSYMDQTPVREIDVHRGLESTLTMLQHRLKRGVAVVREYDSGVPVLHAHGSELNQVWTNLVDNALDAMREKGELRVRTAREFGRVLVEITDSGPGIPAEIQERVFEPFFTTKGVGEGTGLGLDTVYRIVRKHHGEVRFDSHPGRTTFQVRLPLTAEAH